MTSPNRSDSYLPELATCLANLGIRRADLGRHRQARVATQEAVTIYRHLAADHPERHRPDLAAALSDLGLRFPATGTPSAALPVSKEAVHIYRELASASPSRYLPGLATSLTDLGAILSRIGKATAAPAADRKLCIYQELSGTDPGRYHPECASALANLAGDSHQWTPSRSRPPRRTRRPHLPGSSTAQPRPVRPLPSRIPGHPRQDADKARPGR